MKKQPRKLTQLLTLGLERLTTDDWDMGGCLNMARCYGLLSMKEFNMVSDYIHERLETLPFWKESSYWYTSNYLYDHFPGCNTRAEARELRKELYFFLTWDAARRGL